MFFIPWVILTHIVAEVQVALDTGSTDLWFVLDVNTFSDH